MAVIVEPESAPLTQTVATRKHRRATRWMHWINFPLLSIMIWSGLRIYWADTRDPFGFGVGLVGWHWFDFLPDPVNETFGLERKLAKGMAYHFTFGWFFVLNGLAYVLFTARSGEWRKLLPERRSASDALLVVRHDLFIRNKPLPPQGKYNGAQRWSYSLIVFLGAIAVITGFAIYKPTQLNLLTSLFGGYENARAIHFGVTMAFIGFFVVHLLQVARAGWRNFTSMVTGYELKEVSVDD
ncbi:MAG: thiosulfate reductase cytochrome b subunit [Acidimicrobiales bacterium]|jgi:thiosulfate reductase cytochrome b subunit